MPYSIDRAAYAGMFGPTTGDRIRLADTDLIIEVEDDKTIYGEEVKFGGGKVIRDGMGQSQVSREDGAVDTVITNALIVDHWGIIKADVGIRDGRIAAIGKAGNGQPRAGSAAVTHSAKSAIRGGRKSLTSLRLRRAMLRASRSAPNTPPAILSRSALNSASVLRFSSEITGSETTMARSARSGLVARSGIPFRITGRWASKTTSSVSE